jgi:hypothetical protein
LRYGLVFAADSRRFAALGNLYLSISPMMLRILVTAVCLFVPLTAACAEVFVLKSGGQVEGEQLNKGRERGQPYHLRTEGGVKLALADSAVLRVIVKTDLDKQYEAFALKLENTVESQWNMAEWCKEVGLHEQRKRHLAAVITLDPNHAEARRALGYQRFGSRWLTQEEFMQSQGYVRYKGAWRLKQEIEIDSRKTEYELATKKLRKDIRLWFEQVATGGRLADSASRNLNAVDQPEAAPALAEVLADTQQPRSIRRQALEMLSKLPPGLASATLVRIAMNDADGSLRDACLDELQRQGAHSVLPAFLLELKSKDNARVNRAAECLERLGDKSATLPLINALVTEHKFVYQQGGPPGSTSTTFSPSGGGGIAMGNKSKVVTERLKNPSVRAALLTLNPDAANNQYDIPSNVDLRRAD